jgi:hypothetical protein
MVFQVPARASYMLRHSSLHAFKSSGGIARAAASLASASASKRRMASERDGRGCAARWAACLHAFEQNSRGRRRAATALFPHRLQYTSSRCVRLHARDSLRFAVIFALDFLRPAAWHSGEHVRAAQ